MTKGTTRRCNAKKRQGEGNCTQPAGWGTKHPGFGPCKLHGGSSPSVAGLVAEQQARELFGKIAPEIVPIDNPLAAYAELAGEVMAWKQLMNALLADLRSVDITTAAGEQARATVQLYERSMDRANTVLASYARLGIDERLAKVTEAQAKTISRALEAVIAYFGGNTEQAAGARKIAAQHLRGVS